MSVVWEPSFKFNHQTLSELIESVHSEYLQLCRERVLLRQFFNLSDEDEDKVIVFECCRQISKFEEILSHLHRIKQLNTGLCRNAPPG